jgi:hypothetical protein
MIFSNNSTALGAGSIPMAEGYDCSFGPALALVEGARNDYAMFRAMLNVESRELQIRNESAGYVTEGEIAALAEAAGAGIWTKIKELFSKLVAKIKAIFHNFMAKLNSLTKSNKEMVKKYEKEILRKTNIGNLEVKWRKVKNSPIEHISSGLTVDFKEIQDDAANWKEEADERFKFFAGSEPSEYENDMMEDFFDDEETLQIKEINGNIRGICNYLSTFDKNKSNVTKFVNTITSSLTKLVNEANKAADQKAKDKASDDEIKTANHVYDMAVAYQDWMLKMCSVTMNAIKIEYKQNKAAFMKAIAANDKKLEESAVLLNAIAEEAEQEVEDVISGSIDDVDLTNTNNASTNVLDPGVSSDPDELVYADDPDYTEADTAGTVDTNVNSREESAFFGKMLY